MACLRTYRWCGSANSWGGEKLRYSNEHKELQVQINWKWLEPNCHPGKHGWTHGSEQEGLYLVHTHWLLHPLARPLGPHRPAFPIRGPHLLRLYIQFNIKSLWTQPYPLNQRLKMDQSKILLHKFTSFFIFGLIIKCVYFLKKENNPACMHNVGLFITDKPPQLTGPQ